MEDATKPCPYCGETILAVAIKCKYCGEWLAEKPSVKAPPPPPPRPQPIPPPPRRVVVPTAAMPAESLAAIRSDESTEPVATSRLSDAAPVSDDTMEYEKKVKALKRFFRARELNKLENVMQMSFFYNKGWRIDTFSLADGILSITWLNGNSLSCPLLDIKVRYQIDQYDRREVFIHYGGKKYHFKQLPWALKDEEWEEIFAILELSGDYARLKFDIAVNIVRGITGEARKIFDS